MKTTLKSYSFTLIFILLTTFIFSLVLTILKQNDLISLNVSNIVTNILSLSLFFIGALLLGTKQKSKGLINGLILALLYICICLISGITFDSVGVVIKFIAKILLIMLGAIVGVNLKK